jgi:hypothetical protein
VRSGNFVNAHERDAALVVVGMREAASPLAERSARLGTALGLPKVRTAHG